jgi:hypothetical protein
MTPISSHKPPRPDDINDFAFAEQRVFELKCIDGDDVGTEVLYKTSSVGGMRACDNFFAKLVEQLRTDPAHPVAIVQLESDSYQHSQYGQTFVPIIEIVGWADMTGVRADAEEEEVEEPENGTATAPNTAPPPPAKAKGKASLKSDAGSSTPPATARAGAAPRRQRPAERAG